MPKYEWIARPKGFVLEIVAAAILPSGISICTIRAVNTGGIIFKVNTEYRVETTFRHRTSGRPIGGFYSTFEEAKKAADAMLAIVFGGESVAENDRG